MDRTALVTGGTGGLGAAVTSRLLADGWRVVVPWHTDKGRQRLPDSDGLELVQADLLDADDARRSAEQAASRSDAPLRAVVNLVGGFGMGPKLHEASIDDFEQLLRLNLRPTFLSSQAAIPHMIDAGGGAIVCISSRAAQQPFSGASGYVTSKAAVLGLVGSLAAEYRSEGIRANAVLPNLIDTPANREAMPNSDRKTWASAESVADVIAFLCGDGSGVVNGAQVPVHG